MPIDVSRLLCESCGYDLTGLSAAAMDAKCPECGRAIAASRPERRIGSPWQRGRGFHGWWRTLTIIVRRPRTCWDEFAVESRRADRLEVVNACVGSVPVAAVLLAASWDDMAKHPGLALAETGLSMAAALVFFGVPVILLTWIERTGIRYFGRRRGWRITREVSRTICAHASYGWILSGLLVSLGWHFMRRSDLPLWLATPKPWLGGREILPVGIAVPALLFLAFLPGMILFECWVYAGFVRMRYANVLNADARTTSIP